jgi:hypothetical protein
MSCVTLLLPQALLLAGRHLAIILVSTVNLGSWGPTLLLLLACGARHIHLGRHLTSQEVGSRRLLLLC